MLRDDFHFRLSSWQRHTRSEPGDNAEKVAAVVGELLLCKRKRNIELVVWIGETAGPKPVAKQGDVSGAGAIFCGRECAAEHRIGFEDRKNVSRKSFAVDT